jgi:hypothetical protein
LGNATVLPSASVSTNGAGNALVLVRILKRDIAATGLKYDDTHSLLSLTKDSRFVNELHVDVQWNIKWLRLSENNGGDVVIPTRQPHLQQQQQQQQQQHQQPQQQQQQQQPRYIASDKVFVTRLKNKVTNFFACHFEREEQGRYVFNVANTNNKQAVSCEQWTQMALDAPIVGTPYNIGVEEYLSVQQPRRSLCIIHELAVDGELLLLSADPEFNNFRLESALVTSGEFEIQHEGEVIDLARDLPSTADSRWTSLKIKLDILHIFLRIKKVYM